MPDIKSHLREARTQEVLGTLNETIDSIQKEGYTVEFGKIGKRTTYALLTSADGAEEIVGYTFIKDLKYYQENLGKLKALQQAIARRDLTPKS